MPAPAPPPPPRDDAEKLLVPREVARLFRVDPKTITRWEQAGHLSAIKTLGGQRRYPEKQILALLHGGDGPIIQALKHAREVAVTAEDHTAAGLIAALITTLRTREPR